MYLPYHFVVSDCSNVVKGGVYVGFEVSNGRGIGGFFLRILECQKGWCNKGLGNSSWRGVVSIETGEFVNDIIAQCS